jgi:inward rectifier potassium channel
LRLSALCDEVSEDGHRMRRVRDLELVRDNQPLFSLSWTVIHQIDQHSPLFGVDENSIGERLITLIATVTGYDGTYSQTVHARQTWYPEDFRWGQRFLDVISELDDGRLVINYRDFHRTEPDPTLG